MAPSSRPPGSNRNKLRALSRRRDCFVALRAPRNDGVWVSTIPSASLRAKRSNLGVTLALPFVRNPQHRAGGLAGNLREGAAVDVLAALQESDRVGLADREIRA